MVKIEKNLEVRPSLKMDILKGWVRINKSDRTNEIKRKDICFIKVKETGKGLIREIRGIDNKRGLIQLDFESRNELGVSEGKKYTFEIKKIENYDIINIIKFYQKHPERGIRLSIMLGIISLIMGFISLTLGIISVYVTLK